MEKKYLKGKLNRNVAFGLAWISYVIPGLVGLLALLDSDVIDLEDKKEMAAIFICSVASTVLGCTCVVPAYLFVCVVISCIMAFMGKSFKIPGVQQLVDLIIKE